MKLSAEQYRVAARAIMYFVGAWFVRKGYIHSEAELQGWLGGMLYAGTFIWSFSDARQMSSYKAALNFFHAKTLETSDPKAVIISPNGGRIPDIAEIEPHEAKAIIEKSKK